MAKRKTKKKARKGKKQKRRQRQKGSVTERVAAEVRVAATEAARRSVSSLLLVSRVERLEEQFERLAAVQRAQAKTLNEQHVSGFDFEALGAEHVERWRRDMKHSRDEIAKANSRFAGMLKRIGDLEEEQIERFGLLKRCPECEKRFRSLEKDRRFCERCRPAERRLPFLGWTRRGLT
jgi:hypothetical protein